MEGVLKIKSVALPGGENRGIFSGWKSYNAILDDSKPELIFLKDSDLCKPVYIFDLKKDSHD